MRINWFYIFIVLFFAAMMFVSLRYFRSSKNSSVGIAHGREYKISADKPATVGTVNVVSGQQVKKGDLLVAMVSNNTEIEIAKLTNRLDALRAEQAEKVKLAESQIAFVKAELGIEIEKINSDILQSESELALNARIAGNLALDSVSTHPIRQKLQALRMQKLRQQQAMDIRIRDIQQQRTSEQQLLSNQIDLLKSELQIMVKEREMLNKFATADGVVESIYVRQGEQVDAFTSLLSVRPLHPTTIIAYMIGNKKDLPVGERVRIRSYEASSAVEGKVIGYGSVVELPEILQKSTAVKAFGREVFIEIPADNDFASGEKVLVQ